jgi:NAD(P)-dependent dehydrogenase (short-subunit alcohol dehydrogenase family)
MSGLTDRVAVVVGSGTGIGAATATLLAERGATVVLADLAIDGVRSVAKHLQHQGLTASAHTVDVGSEEAVSELFAHVESTYGRLDILHNNAAAMDLNRHDPDVTQANVDDWDRAFTVNTRGVFLGTKHAIPLMVRSGGGSIVNTCSISGQVGELVMTAYGASKAAVAQLTRSTATQWGKHGIRCNAVSPGLILTEAGLKVPEALRDIYLRHTLTPYLGAPEDVANMVAFLASDDARYVTAQIIAVDGGLTAHNPIAADYAEWVTTATGYRSS